jgi:hypothetical protein
MDANAAVLLVFLVLALAFNGREAIRRGLARVPVLLRARRWAR